MNALSRYAMMADRSSRASAMDDVGGPRGGSSSLGGEPILMSYQQGNMLAPQQQPGMGPSGGDDIDARLTHELMTKANSREEAEAMLRQFSEQSGDDGLAAVNRVAKQLGIRAPWHRDFGAPPGQMPGAIMGPMGRPRPLQRDDGY